MSRYEINMQRLHVSAALSTGAQFDLDEAQAHYLINVLRMKAGDPILVFNGRDGEWRANVAKALKRRCSIVAVEATRPQTTPCDLHYLFAPLKKARLDFMVQKATEMGVSRLQPVMTKHTVAERINLERMRANAIEAAEQCGILTIPEVGAPVALAEALAGWDPSRRLIWCDENAPSSDPIAALRSVPRGPLALLIGPEGGFSLEERALLARQPFVIGISLGPRILRADTAATAALALVQATLGDMAV